MFQMSYETQVVPPTFKHHVYIPNEPLIAAIEQAIKNPLRGARVLFAPYNSGKTTAVHNVVANFQKNKTIAGALITSDWTTVTESLGIWIRESKFGLQSTNAIHGPLSDAISATQDSPLVIVFDQFDDIMLTRPLEAKVLITNLAQDSYLKRNYVLLVVVRSMSFFKTILTWNGGQKIRPCFLDILEFKWKREDLEKLMGSFKSDSQWTTEQRTDILDAAVKAGTPGFLLETLTSINLYSKNKTLLSAEASALAIQWETIEDNINI